MTPQELLWMQMRGAGGPNADQFPRPMLPQYGGPGAGPIQLRRQPSYDPPVGQMPGVIDLTPPIPQVPKFVRQPNYDPPSVMQNAPDLLNLLPGGRGGPPPSPRPDSAAPNVLDAPWFQNAPAGRGVKSFLEQGAGVPALGNMANKYLWDPWQHFLTGRHSYEEPATPQQAYPSPIGPEEPQAAASAAPRAAPSTDPLTQMYMDMLKGGGAGGSGVPAMPKFARRSYPSEPVPQMEKPTKPDYTEADKLIEQSKPTDREKSDSAFALIAGMMSGFDPRPGEKFGVTLGRMAGPGMKGYLATEEKNKDIEVANKDRQAQWNMLRGTSLGQRAEAAAALATAGSKVDYENQVAKWQNLIKKEDFEAAQDAAEFGRWHAASSVGIQGKTADAHMLAAKAAVARAFATGMETSSHSPTHDVQQYHGDIANGKIAFPPGAPQDEITNAAQAAVAAERKTNPALIPGSKEAELRFKQHVMKGLNSWMMSLTPEQRDAYSKIARSSRVRRPVSAGAAEE